MTASFSSRRRADEFEALLSQGPDAALTQDDAERFTLLLSVVSDLRALPEVTARPEFVGSLRESLMTQADTDLVTQPAARDLLALPTGSGKRERRIAVLLGSAALVGATATMAVAAQTSLPGESLYPVKRGLEAVELRLANGDAARGRAQLANAEARLIELEALAASDERSAAQLLPDTIDDFTEQSSGGVRSLLTAYAQTGEPADVERARTFTAASMERLDALESRVPANARDELVAAGRTLADLDLEADIACPSCTGGITRTPDFLLTSTPTSLLSGLDTDDATLEAAPISGQDLSGISIPELLQPQTSLPTRAPDVVPGSKTGGRVDHSTRPVKNPGKDINETVGNTTNEIATTLDDLTGGAVGGLTSGLDNATGGLIGEVTGTLDQVTGGTIPGGKIPGPIGQTLP